MIRIVVNGAFGKMGRLAVSYLEQSVDCQIVGQLGRSDDLKEALARLKPDVVVDLTSADCVYQNALLMIESKINPVIGTSGLSLEQICHLSDLCEAIQLGALVVPNFSLGAALMLTTAKKVISFFPEVEITEAHHSHKKDAPSGTARYTAQKLSEIRHQERSRDEAFSRGEWIEGIPVHSIRLSGVLAEQDILFGHVGETLRLHHQVIDRMAYMPGLKLACMQVQRLSSLCYGLDALLETEKWMVQG